jgi:hypothetical protein
MKKSSGLLILSLAVMPLAAMGEAYKCHSPDGKITYAGQMSMSKDVQCEQMFVKKPPISSGEKEPAGDSTQEKVIAPADATAKVTEQKTQADKELEAKRKKTEADEARKKADNSVADKQAEQKVKDDNCHAAKINLEAYKMGRIQRIDEKGERYFLDDATLAKEKAQAEKDIAENCK